MSAQDDQKQVRESIEHIANQAAKNAVREVMELFGIDTTKPIEAQAQFAALRALSSPKAQSDLAFLARLHGAADVVSDTSWKTAIRVLLTAAFGLVAVVTREYWLSHIWK